MEVPTQTAHPVQTLRDHSTSFEAALAVCLAESRVKAVHKLRTESRRLEAQIALLKAVRGLPPFRPEAEKALWQIKKLRQAAGRVRDLDVQTEHLEKHAKKTRASALPEEAKQQALTDLEQMLAKRAERRVHAAEALAVEIRARQVKVATAFEKLNAALKHAARRMLPSAELLAIAERGFERMPALRLRKPSADDLHTVRKAAKQARYLAENAGTAKAAAAAKRYEHLQELGGEWHDWLDLTAAARRELGKKHTLSGEFLTFRVNTLEKFRAELAGFQSSAQSKAKTRKPAKNKRAIKDGGAER